MSVFVGIQPPPPFDFYDLVNGKFLRDAKIPTDRTSVSHWNAISDGVDSEMIAAMKDTAIWKRATDKPTDESNAALRELMAIADRVVDGPDASFALGELHAAGVDALFSAVRIPNSQMNQSDVYVLHLGEGGIGLPTGSYYIDTEIAEAYRAHVKRVLCEVAGVEEPDVDGAFKTEHAVCKSEFSPADAQDVRKTTNPTALCNLPAGLDWMAYMKGLGVLDAALVKMQDINVECPNSLARGAALVKDGHKSSALRAYLHWRCADLLAAQMGPVPEALQFEFYGKRLSGQVEILPQSKRRCDTLSQLLPEYVGGMFVNQRAADHKRNKQVAQELVDKLVATLRASFEKSIKIPEADCKQWLEKLNKLTVKVGYPDKMSTDGEAVSDATHAAVKSGAAWPSVVLAAIRERRKVSMSRIGQPIDATCWTDMQAQTVNACFIAETNEIVIPAAILRPPIFDPLQGDAFNMGSLGAVVGHELSHGFDPNGAQFDSHGKLLPKAIRRWYKAMAAVVDRQATRAGANAKLTSGENVADAAGLRLAHITMMQSFEYRVGGPEEHKILNRIFFEQWARLWACKMTPDEEKRKHMVDPHPQARLRCNEVYNIDEFYSTYPDAASSKEFIPPRQRAKMWFV